MNLQEFKNKMKEKFQFDEEETFLSSSEGTILVHTNNEGIKTEINNFNEIPIEDTELHFKATSILDVNGGTDELILITEPGKYENHVFWNCHEEDLYSIDCIDEYEDDIDDEIGLDKYEAFSKEKKIEFMPFFQNPVANSLEDLFNNIKEEKQ